MIGVFSSFMALCRALEALQTPFCFCLAIRKTFLSQLGNSCMLDALMGMLILPEFWVENCCSEISMMEGTVEVL